MTYRNRLLVATPNLDDANFALTVILVLEHDPGGAFGIVLNRPTTMAVPEALAGWTELVSDPPVLFVGGPVQPEVVLVVGRSHDGDRRGPDAPAPLPPGFRLADPSEPPQLSSLSDVRAFAGYAGWGPGQLEAEVGDGGWFVVDFHPTDVLTSAPETLWRQVLRRQGGLFTTATPDPTAN